MIKSHHYKYPVVALFLLVTFIFSNLCIAEEFKATGTIEVLFSPKGGATEAVVKEIDNARSDILIQAYSFTSAPIAKALVEAKKRGIEVEAVLDKSQRKEKYTSATFISNAGIPFI